MPGNTNRDKIEDPCSECKSKHEMTAGGNPRPPLRKSPVTDSGLLLERHVKCMPRSVSVARIVRSTDLRQCHYLSSLLSMSRLLTVPKVTIHGPDACSAPNPIPSAFGLLRRSNSGLDPPPNMTAPSQRANSGRQSLELVGLSPASGFHYLHWDLLAFFSCRVLCP